MMAGSRKRRIVLLSGVVRYTPHLLKQLEQDGFEISERLDLVGSTDEAQLISALAGAWGTVAGSERYTRSVFEAVPTLQVIARPGVGYDAIDMKAATEHNVAVTITPGANTESVADLTLALILSCLRRVVANDAAVRSGIWRPPDLARDLFQATVGIVGLGRIGQAVARRLKGFDCRLLAVESNPDLDFCQRMGLDLLTLAELLPRVDILTLHVPLLTATHHLISRPEFELMRRPAMLVNTSRGPVVDEEALVWALRDNLIAGAGLDVFEREPLPADHDLLGLPNVVLSGHVASFSERGVDQMMKSVVASLVEIGQGTIPNSCINASALTRS
jgi:phosphoglycerate dehydrogenase-like enzyme